MRYYCKKYSRWMTRREIIEVHKGRCFRIRKGPRKDKSCRMLVKVT
ncbi:hypothetical protein ES706_05764 [subsurface metagenome]